MSFFLKNKKRESKTGLSGRAGTSGRREDIKKGCGRLNMVEYYV
jgi:hypothetical protein